MADILAAADLGTLSTTLTTMGALIVGVGVLFAAISVGKRILGKV